MHPRLFAHVITTSTHRDARLAVVRGDELLLTAEIDDETLDDYGWIGHDQAPEDQADGLLRAALDVLDKRYILPSAPYASLLEYDAKPEDGHPAIHIITTVAGENDPL